MDGGVVSRLAGVSAWWLMSRVIDGCGLVGWFGWFGGRGLVIVAVAFVILAFGMEVLGNWFWVISCVVCVCVCVCMYGQGA